MAHKITDCVAGMGPRAYIGVEKVFAVPMTKKEFLKRKNENFTVTEKNGEEDQDGYLVLYPNNYESWSPKKVFENSYAHTTYVGSGKSFGEALIWVTSGKGMRLPTWKEDVEIRIHMPKGLNEYTKGSNEPTAPFLYVKSRFGISVWIPNMIELLSNEWQVID